MANTQKRTSKTISKRICPRCKSTNISPDLSVEAYAQGSIFNKYLCNNCGYSSQFFPEIVKEKSKSKN